MEIARSGNFNLSLRFKMHVKDPNDLAPFIDIMYFQEVTGAPAPGDPYLAGLTLFDIANRNCDWTVADIDAFAEVVASDRGQAWLRTQFDELSELIRTVKAPLPENLHGLFE